jgi:hypothetical protein
VQCRERLKGWTGCCIIIIKKPRNLAEKSRMILWLEVDRTCARTIMLLANAQVSRNIVCAVDKATRGWATSNALQVRESEPGSIF